MRLGTLLKDPDNNTAASINWDTHIGNDTLSSCAWVAATGLTIVGSPSVSGDVATAVVSGGQEGCDYNLVCTATLSSGVTVDGTIVVQVRTGEADPRLTR